MIIQGITKGLTRARANLTLDNMEINSTVGFASGMGSARAVELVGGRFATYEAIYRCQPWVFAGINRLARGVGRLPLPIFVDGGRDGERERVREGSLFDLIRRPWTTMGTTAVQPGTTTLLTQKIVMSCLIHGFTVFIKDYSLPRGRRSIVPTQLKPTRSFNWEPQFSPVDGSLTFWLLRTPRGRIEFAPEDLWVIGPEGVGPGGLPSSPMEALRNTIASDDATDRAIIQRFEKGARPSGFVSFKEEVKNLKEVKAQAELEYGGEANWYGMMMLDRGASYEQFGASFVDSEMTKLKLLNREVVAAVLNTPQSSMGILEHATFSNVSDQHQGEYQDSYDPWTGLIQQSFQAQVIDPEPEWRGNYVEYNYKQILKGDPLKEQETLVKSSGGPVLTPNEARGSLNLPPVDGGDELREPQNMTSGAQDPNANDANANQPRGRR